DDLHILKGIIGALAAANGLPIISTKGEMLEEAFIHESNVVLYFPKSPEAVAEAILTLMDRPDLRHRLRMGALQLAREWFSWDKAVQRLSASLRPNGSGAT